VTHESSNTDNTLSAFHSLTSGPTKTFLQELKSGQGRRDIRQHPNPLGAAKRCPSFDIAHYQSLPPSTHRRSDGAQASTQPRPEICMRCVKSTAKGGVAVHAGKIVAGACQK
jgi:hypothetical protein